MTDGIGLVGQIEVVPVQPVVLAAVVKDHVMLLAKALPATSLMRGSVFPPRNVTV